VPAPDEKSKPADDKPKAADDRQTSAKPPEPRKSEETARAEAALSATGAYVVTLGTFGQAENVKQLQARLAKEGIKSYTEPVKTAKGEQTRVRAGPFENRDAAEQARERLKGMGIDVGNVALRQ
jgi:DedD protein